MVTKVNGVEMKVNESTNIAMPIKNLISIIVAVGIGVWDRISLNGLVIYSIILRVCWKISMSVDCTAIEDQYGHVRHYDGDVSCVCSSDSYIIELGAVHPYMCSNIFSELRLAHIL